MAVTEKTANRLINETSPYLIQHARNPVDWWPWCDAAFEKARLEDKPVFLSIGYSTCHWCHVMERESFEDDAVARLLNRGFVSIKVDREERPDVDLLYMNACVALNGDGGWPLTVFLDHERRPFWAGTYIPKQDSRGRMGLLTLLDRVKEAWYSEREKLLHSADGIIRHLSRSQGGRRAPDGDAAANALRGLLAQEDHVYGGFGGAPKFPSPHNLLFLMRAGVDKPSDAPLWRTVRRQLDGMAAGGIRDHIGGGFCRYSTDAKWLVPHFEKMLYDNALLLMCYAECFQKTREPAYAAVSEETALFLLRELSAPEGGFYTGLDADSEGEEGKFYLLTPSDVGEALPPDDAERFCRLYGITASGNFEGASIPNLIGRALDREDGEFAAGCAGRLYEYRSRRSWPMRDEKQMLSGTALAAAAFAAAGRALERPEWVERAIGAVEFILRELLRGGRLMASWKDGRADIPATLDGSAYFVWALLELHQATLDPAWLGEAVHFQTELAALFGDGEGGLSLSGSDMTDLPARSHDPRDGATPSGHSVALHNAARLFRLTGDPRWDRQARELLASVGGLLSAYPTAHVWSCAAADAVQRGGADIVIASGWGMDRLLEALRGYHPDIVVSACGDGYPGMDELAPFTSGMRAQHGRAAAYVCRDGACNPPATEPAELRSLLFGG